MARKGQAALEYIITYGWGFIVIIVVVGVLAYFGLFSPSRYVPSRCEFGAQLQCADYQLQHTPGAVKIKFRNNFGDDIDVTKVYIFSDTTPSWSDGTTIDKGNVSGDIVINIADPDAVLPEGDRISVPVVVTFRRTAPQGPEHNVTGEIFATVQ